MSDESGFIYSDMLNERNIFRTTTFVFSTAGRAESIVIETMYSHERMSKQSVQRLYWLK